MADTYTPYYTLTKPECSSVNWCASMNTNLDIIDTELNGVEARVGDLIQNGTGIIWAYDGGAGTLTPTVTFTGLDTDSLTEGSTNLYYTDERVDDRVTALLTAGSGLTETYDDAANTLTLDLGALTVDWDAGAYEIRALTFESDQATGTAPFTVASTTVVSNLNASYLEGYSAADFDIFYLEFVIDGQGSAISTDQKGHLEVPLTGTIVRATALADQSGSIVVDIWKDTYANFPPANGDSITASAPVTITTATKAQDSTLTGWTKTMADGDILAFNVDSCTTITRCTISLKCQRIA